MTNPTVAARLRFNEGLAPQLALQVGAAHAVDGPSERFAWFGDSDQLVVLAGPQEIEHRGVDLALAYGLHERGERTLRLVLPEAGAFSTLQRVPWLKSSVPCEVWTYRKGEATKAKAPTRAQTKKNVSAHLKEGVDPAEDMREASTPKYLKGAAAPLAELVLWLNEHPQLDNGHRKSERSWQCMGQRVLSIRSAHGALRIRAGIHKSEDVGWTSLPVSGQLTRRQLESLKSRVQRGIAERLEPGGKYNKPDEHWLQAVIRTRPSLVGLEQPVLREVPAWRPLGTSAKWARAFIDLVGVDGLGDLKIVETKLSTNVDDLLIFQGLDYFIWSLAYKAWLAERLYTSRRVDDPTVEYVIGSTVTGAVHVSHRAASQAAALDIPWRFRVITNWYTASADPAKPTLTLLPSGELP